MISSTAYVHSFRHGIGNTLYNLFNINLLPDAGTEVIPHLWLGSLTTVTPEFIRINNISAIVNLSGYRYDYGVTTYYLSIADKEVTIDEIDIYIGAFTIVANIIEKNMAESRNILVHCAAGVNRSAAAIVMYLILHGLSYEDAVKQVTDANYRRNSPTLTNASFRQLLKTCESFKRQKIAVPETSNSLIGPI